MDLCIIIGFNYKFEDNYLPGTIIDIYNCYKYISKLAKSTHIFTDIEKDITVSELRNSVLNASADINIINFISNIKSKKDIYHLYTSKDLIITEISKIIKNKKRIFFYYSGHSNNSKLVFPTKGNEICYVDSTELELINLKKIICQNSLENAQIFFVLDCCNSNGLGLPYKLKDGKYVLSVRFYFDGKSSEIMSNSLDISTQEIICISSTMYDEYSISSDQGSLFTQSFFKNLKEYRKIEDLLHVVNMECLKKYNQTSTIFASYPNLKHIWRWLVVNDKIEIDIDLINNFFIIKTSK